MREVRLRDEGYYMGCEDIRWFVWMGSVFLYL